VSRLSAAAEDAAPLTPRLHTKLRRVLTVFSLQLNVIAFLYVHILLVVLQEDSVSRLSAAAEDAAPLTRRLRTNLRRVLTRSNRILATALRNCISVCPRSSCGVTGGQREPPVSGGGGCGTTHAGVAGLALGPARGDGEARDAEAARRTPGGE